MDEMDNNISWIHANETSLWYIWDTIKQSIDGTGRSILSHMSFSEFCNMAAEYSDTNPPRYHDEEDSDHGGESDQDYTAVTSPISI